MTEDRRLAVLRAIVEDYVETHEPVGSRTLVERHHLGVSPATIRNDMAALEDDGYLAAPHTSAGRIPTELGYRLFVDRLAEIKPLSAGERSAIVRFLDGAVDLDDVMTRTVRLLAQLTRQVALVQYPSVVRSKIRHLEVLSISETRLLLVVILDSGRVEQRVVELPNPLEDLMLDRLRSALCERLVGARVVEVGDLLVDLPDVFDEADRSLVRAVVSTLCETIVQRRDERVVVAGAANLAALGDDFHGSVRPVLEALEEHIVLLQLLGESVEPSGIQRLTVRIGHETEVDALSQTSLITATYGQADEPLASLGILGPTRMDYPVTMSAVSAVARYVGRMLT